MSSFILTKEQPTVDLADLKEFVFNVKSALKNEISALIEMETEGEEAQGKDYY